MSSAWQIASIATPHLTWGNVCHGQRHSCPNCGIILLTGEQPGFCCGPNGNRLQAIPPLPPLPPEFDVFMHDNHISQLSCKLNLLFSFTSLESTQTFLTLGTPSFITIASCTYHYIHSQPHDDSAIWWILFDGFDSNRMPHATHSNQLPPEWVTSFRQALS
jgi:hypothetical protein